MDQPTIGRSYRGENIVKAKQLRRDMTPAEVILWRELRAHRFAGYQFRRQQPIGTYIADFICHSVKLIVELDGETHVGRESEDQRRQERLEESGYRVIRFLNSDVYDDKDMVLENIWRACLQPSLGVE